MIRSVYLLLISLLSLQAVAQQAWIRINQLGYTGGDIKVAVLVAKDEQTVAAFSLVEAGTGKEVWTGTALPTAAYAAFQKSWRLNFSAFQKEGTYYLKAGSVKSPEFRIQNKAYNGTADFILKYMRQQRSGYNPFLKDSCHRQDGFIVYHKDRSRDSTYINVPGGWHDASDYLQYLPTSANATYQMLFAYTQHPQSFSDHYDAWGHEGANKIPDIIDEAKWGLDWLVKMNPGKGEYYNQLADDRDHTGLRLPNRDSVKYAPGKGLARPVYFITGQPQGEKYKNKTRGVASSAGKFASAFALGAIVMKEFYPEFAQTLISKAKDAYEFGRQYPGNTQTLSVKAPYIYAEENDADDMELAALSLYQLTKHRRYLNEAIVYARIEPVTPWMGADTANHYQWYPFVNLGHYWGALLDTDRRAEYISFMKQGIDKVVSRGEGNPFLNGVPFIWCSNNLVVGILTQMSLYKRLTGDQTYNEAEASLRGWLFGCNPWGAGMICDLPEKGVTPKDPHSAFTYLYKHKISGGLVDGPVYGSIWSKLIGIKLYAEDEYKDFQSNLVVYHDDFGDYSTNEPTMDGTASLSYYLSSLQDNSAHNDVYDSEGAIIKLGSKEKKVYLIFSAHEFGEGGKKILDVLKAQKVKGNFFLTGDFLRNRTFKNTVQRIVHEGHYLGSHSDRHLLYADWSKRGSLLVTRDFFQHDLDRSLLEIKKAGAGKGQWYLPPYEWYNKEIVAWCKENGLRVINFTPGTGTNADYTWPELPNYRSSDNLLQRLWEREQQQGLNGSFILIHLGTDPRRTDKLYNRLDELINGLTRRGYSIDKLP